MIGSGYTSPSHAASGGGSECSYCHLPIPWGQNSGLVLTSTDLGPNEQPRTHQHCTKLLTELEEYKDICSTSEDHIPVSLRCGGCDRNDKNYVPHDVDIWHRDTKFVTFHNTEGTPGIFPYCDKSAGRLEMSEDSDSKTMSYNEAIAFVEANAKKSRKAWERRMRQHTVSTSNRSRGGSPSGRSSEAGPSFSRQPEETGQGQDTSTDKGKGLATPLGSGTSRRIDVHTSVRVSTEPDVASPYFRGSIWGGGIDLDNLPNTLGPYPPAGEEYADEGPPTALVPGPTTEMHATQEHHSQCCTCSSCCPNCVSM